MEFLLRALWASSSVPVGIRQLARIARPTRARCLKRARLQFRVLYIYIYIYICIARARLEAFL